MKGRMILIACIGLLGIIMAVLIARSEDTSTTEPVVESEQVNPCEGFEPREFLDLEEQEFLRILNDYRVNNGLPLVNISVELAQAANWMSNDMATQGYEGHTDSLGRGVKDRITEEGHFLNPRSEILVNVAEDALSAFRAWRDSAGHNALMLDPNARYVGIARVCREDSESLWYWTVDFA